MPLFRRFTRNTAGRDYIVGDIHGCFGMLSAHLQAIGFNADAGDRLFAVGDLVDRGPESERAVEWLRHPWFFAVQGNHDDMAVRWPNGNMDAGNYIANGGAWNVFSGVDAQLDVSLAFAELPIAIELETSSGPVGIVHADCPMPSWPDFVSALETGWVRTEGGELHNSKSALKAVIDCAQWSRRRSALLTIGFDVEPVSGVRAVVVGHSIVPDPVMAGNVVFIDTGACLHKHFGGRFTVIDAETLQPVLPVAADA